MLLHGWLWFYLTIRCFDIKIIYKMWKQRRVVKMDVGLVFKISRQQNHKFKLVLSLKNDEFHIS